MSVDVRNEQKDDNQRNVHTNKLLLFKRYLFHINMCINIHNNKNMDAVKLLLSKHFLFYIVMHINIYHNLDEMGKIWWTYRYRKGKLA